MKNHQSHPTRFESFPEVNAISSQNRGHGCGRNPQTMVRMVIIPKILIKEKPHYTTRSGTILRQNKKMGSVYKINLLRIMRIIVIDMV